MYLHRALLRLCETLCILVCLNTGIGVLHTSYTMFWSGISWNIVQVTCIFSIYMRAFRYVCHQENTKWQLGYFMLYHKRVLPNYLTPCHRKYSGQHNQSDTCVTFDRKVGCNTVKYYSFLVFWLAWFCLAWFKWWYHLITRDTLKYRLRKVTTRQNCYYPMKHSQS